MSPFLGVVENSGAVIYDSTLIHLFRCPETFGLRTNNHIVAEENWLEMERRRRNGLLEWRLIFSDHRKAKFEKGRG
jgi:hypothetical protein